jgi:hypothetical protein
VPLLEVEGDGMSAGVQALLDQGLAQRHDLLLHRRRGGLRAVSRATRPRLQAGLTLGVVAADQFLDPPPRHPVVAGDLALGAPLDPHRGDHQPCQRHPHSSSAEM